MVIIIGSIKSVTTCPMTYDRDLNLSLLYIKFIDQLDMLIDTITIL